MAMTRSTFAGFTTATLALAASQRALDVTGQNISNINTEGYTRQRLDLASISPTGASYFQTQTDCRVGQGVEMTGIIRIRDPFIDIQYRTQLAKVGTIDAQDAMLNKVGLVFDETDKQAVGEALNNVVSQLQNMSNPDNSNQGASDTLVRSAMEILLNVLHENGNKIQEVQDDLVEEMQKTNIPDINKYLQNIATINQSIKNTQILGGGALELQDRRDSLIDELATYLPIDVTYHDLNVGGGIKVDTLKISYTDAAGNKYVLVDDAKAGQFDIEPKYPEKGVPVTITVEPLEFQLRNTDGSLGPIVRNPNPDPNDPDADTNFDPNNPTGFFTHPHSIKIAGKDETTGNGFNNIGNGVLKGKVDAVNKAGSFDYPASDFKGVGYYIGMYNSFVEKFATTLNKLNEDAGGGPLFEKIDNSLDWSSTNIKVSDAWMTGGTKIMTKFKDDPNATVDPDDDDKTTANNNVLAMMKAISSDVYEYGYVPTDVNGDPIYKLDQGGNKIQAKDEDGNLMFDGNRNPIYETEWVTVFKGNMFDAYYSLQNTQAIDRKASQSVLTTRMGVLNDISNSKDSVSGVWMDEEVMNLMRYQQSYSAAARLMTTLDEALETLISNTGRVGR